MNDGYNMKFQTYLPYIVHGKCILDNLTLSLNIQDGCHFSRWPLLHVLLSYMGVKSIYFNDAELQFGTL